MRTHSTHERLADWFQSFRRSRSLLRKSWCLSESDLDDVAQEVFLRLLRYENLELIEHPQAHLLRMATHVAGEWSMRSRRRRGGGASGSGSSGGVAHGISSLITIPSRRLFGSSTASIAFRSRCSTRNSPGARSAQAGGEFGNEPVFTRPFTEVDFSAQYDVTDKLNVFFKALNLSNSEIVEHGRFDNQILNVRDYGRTFTIGVRTQLLKSGRHDGAAS